MGVVKGWEKPPDSEAGGFREGELRKIGGFEFFKNIETQWLLFEWRMCQHRGNCPGTKDIRYSLMRPEMRFSV